MKDISLGVWIRRFLLEHLVGERNLARNTQRSYRDTLVLLLPFVAAKLNKAIETDAHRSFG
jgi:integrase/recombinase XerD